MKDSLKIRLISNAGVSMSYRGDAVLVDAINGSSPPFFELPESEFNSMLSKTGEYSSILSLFYTHTHMDHYDAGKNRILSDKTGIQPIVPTENMPHCGTVNADKFTLHFFRTSHSGAEYKDVLHYAFLFEFGGRLIYFASDSDYTTNEQLTALKGIKPDIAFFNPIYTFSESNIALMNEIGANVNYIYHIPTDCSCGYCKKISSCRDRFSSLLKNVVYLDKYPTELEV